MEAYTSKFVNGSEPLCSKTNDKHFFHQSLLWQQFNKHKVILKNYYIILCSIVEIRNLEPPKSKYQADAWPPLEKLLLSITSFCWS